MKRAVLVTGHFAHQKRRPSFLWISDALQQMGWHVTLITVGYSWLSCLTSDKRLQSLPASPRVGIHQVSERLTTVFGYAPIHPLSLRAPLADQLLRPLHDLFPAWWKPRLRPHLHSADLVLVESGAPLMLAPQLRDQTRQAQMIYRVNDDIRLLRPPAFLPRLETEYADLFDRISTPSPHLARRFSAHHNVTLDTMGIPRSALSAPQPNPYPPGNTRKAVCAGTTQLDTGALEQIARDRPAWQIHILGRLKSTPPAWPNLIFHGEQSFATTLAHIAHADVGLAPYLDRPGVEYQTTNSNRILLYRHFGLPILGPDRLCHPSVPTITGYGDPQKYRRCEAQKRRPEVLPDWSDLARRLASHTAQNGVTDPPEDSWTSPATAV